MADEPQLHDLTKLLLTRLESNPEEFSKGNTHSYKWYKAVEAVREHGAKLDKETLNAALHKRYMDEAHVDALKLLMGADENGVGFRATKHPTKVWVQHGPPGGAGNGGSGSVNVNTLGPMLPGTLTHIYDQNTQRHLLTVHGAGTAIMTREEAEDLGLKSKETIIEVLKRKLGL